MAQSADGISIEPGKQLPQAVKVKRAAGDGSEVTLRYMLFVPKDYEAENGDDKKWPLLLFLHGLGECSNDDLSRVKIHGPAKIVDSRPDFPFVVVSPQCPVPAGYDPKAPPKKPGELLEIVEPAWKADELIQLLDYVEKHLNIDRSRVYVTGLSMGGYGTWRLVAKHPERFAAAVPICGGGKPTEYARGLSRVPIWAFHGELDKVVPVSKSREMVDAVRGAGGDAKLTVYPEVEHNSWTPTYDNQEVYDWLLSHRRGEERGSRSE